MSGDNLEQSSAGLQHNAATTAEAVNSVRAARKQMESFIQDFAARSKGSFVNATNQASVEIASIFDKMEARLTKYAEDSKVLDQEIQSANAAAAAAVTGTVQ